MGVGQLIGKLFGGGESPRGEALLRAYGKLPLYAEYRRLEVAPGVATAFSRWLDEGRLAWVKSPTRSDHGVTRHSHVVLRLPEAKELVVASIWDSRDSLGRVFPFSFFVVCSPDALGSSNMERWVAAQRLHKAFDACYTEIGQGGDFYKRYQKRTLALRPDDLESRVQRLRGDALRLAAGDFFDKTLKRDGFTAQDWFAGLVRRAHNWRTQSTGVSELALACPLSSGWPSDQQVAAWLAWLDGWFEGLRPASIIAPGAPLVEAAGGSLCLLGRDPLPDDFQLLTTDDVSYEFVGKLAAAPQTEEPLPTPPPAEGALLAWLDQYASRQS